MDDPVRELRVFVGYQFKSLLMSRTKMLANIITALERVESDVNVASATRVRLRFDRLDLLSGTPLGPQILEAIDRSDICVFEISDLNANVFFEMGYAAGRGKPSVILLNDEMNLGQLPSDIRGNYVTQYREDRLDIKLGEQLLKVVEDLLQEQTTLSE